MDVFVIGGGASGLTAAIKAGSAGAHVTILERNSICGKKLLLTGNSRCNYYNENQDIKFYHSNNIEIFKEIFENKKDNILNFFDELGIIPNIVNGYYYPYSNRSDSVVNALLSKIKSLNIEIKTEQQVINIEKEDKFIITTDKNKFYADKVIISTGSKSYPKTGSDGIGYSLVKNLGHTTTKILPSLVMLEGEGNFYKDLKGVRSNAKLTLVENNKTIKEETGEVQFTDYGISGICTFNLSGIIAKGLNKGYTEKIYINFIPWFKGNKEEFLSWMNNQSRLLNGFTIKNILEGFLNYKVINTILKETNTSKDSTWKNSPKEQIIDLIMNFPINIKSTKSFNVSQTCSGGVPLTEINPKTMESKIVKGLFLTGEILDVDGDCGGYNLSFAWMSGLIAGENVYEED